MQTSSGIIGETTSWNSSLDWRFQIPEDSYKSMSLFNVTAQYKWKKYIFRLEFSNLLNQRSYAYTVFNGINTYSYDYTLCGRTVMFRATFRL